MLFDMTRPCTYCPFRNDATRLKFATEERAREIEEHAYRHGFPCHETGESVEDPFTGEIGIAAKNNSQHCAGYIMMQTKENCGIPWPGMGNDEDLLLKLENQMDRDVPVFESTEEFFAANTGEDL